jgi:hypothetical protein
MIRVFIPTPPSDVLTPPWGASGLGFNVWAPRPLTGGLPSPPPRNHRKEPDNCLEITTRLTYDLIPGATINATAHHRS